MIINNNLYALNAYNRLNANGRVNAVHSSRLSSGKKINSAADDAAGMSISTVMKAQIRGLDRAGINVDEGVSLVKIADGAMSEMVNITQRIRELCVQAANDTHTSEDRLKIQNEIGQLTSELNKITSDTNYNTRSLFDGPISGHYGYDYGLVTLPAEHTPAIIEAGGDITPNLSITYGTQAETPDFSGADANGDDYYVDLDLLEGYGFPTSGTFTIEVTDPFRGTATHTLNFSNPPPITTVADFENYFKTYFDSPTGAGVTGTGPIADFEITADGRIKITTVEEGGSGSSITMSGTAYSAIIGSRASTSPKTHYSLLSRSDSGTYTTLENFWDSIKNSLAGQSNTFKMWGGVHTTGNSWEYGVYKEVTINYSDYANFSDLKAALREAELELFLDREGNIGLSSTSISNNVYKADGTAFATVARKVSIEGGTNAFTGMFNSTNSNNNISGYNNNRLCAASPVTSSYAANISDHAGILEIKIGGTYPRTCIIDFSINPLPFSDATGMKDYIHYVLNSNPPSPAAVYDPALGAGVGLIATVTINTAGKLVITPTERDGTVNVKEHYSDKPMFQGTSHSYGSNSTHSLTIRDDFGNQQTINIAPRPVDDPYDDIDEFIQYNEANFRPNYTLGKSVDNRLIITSVGEGRQYTLSSLTTNPASLLADLGLSPFIDGTGGDFTYLIDGTTTILTPDDPNYIYNGLWIQSGANAWNHLYISIPCLNAHDLGLSLYSIDFQTASLYEGISQIGVENYTGTPNVEDRVTGAITEHGLDVMSYDTATRAISIAENALNILNTERSTLGSVQNRLDAINISLSSASVNQSTANSRIEDADMARELMSKVKYTVLGEASSAMLAQANSNIYKVLDLIK